MKDINSRFPFTASKRFILKGATVRLQIRIHCIHLPDATQKQVNPHAKESDSLLAFKTRENFSW